MLVEYTGIGGKAAHYKMTIGKRYTARATAFNCYSLTNDVGNVTVIHQNFLLLIGEELDDGDPFDDIVPTAKQIGTNEVDAWAEGTQYDQAPEDPVYPRYKPELF